MFAQVVPQLPDADEAVVGPVGVRVFAVDMRGGKLFFSTGLRLSFAGVCVEAQFPASAPPRALRLVVSSPEVADFLVYAGEALLAAQRLAPRQLNVVDVPVWPTAETSAFGGEAPGIFLSLCCGRPLRPSSEDQAAAPAPRTPETSGAAEPGTPTQPAVSFSPTPVSTSAPPEVPAIAPPLPSTPPPPVPPPPVLPLASLASLNSLASPSAPGASPPLYPDLSSWPAPPDPPGAPGCPGGLPPAASGPMSEERAGQIFAKICQDSDKESAARIMCASAQEGLASGVSKTKAFEPLNYDLASSWSFSLLLTPAPEQRGREPRDVPRRLLF